MRIHFITKFIPIAVLMAFFCGCSGTSKVITSWKDESYQVGTVKKPLVMFLLEKSIVRNKVEDDLTVRLKEMGLDAVQSYRYFSDLKGLSADAVKGRLGELGRDGVLLIIDKGMKNETVVVPPRTDVYSTSSRGYYGNHGMLPVYYGNFGDYYSTYNVVSTPGYTYDIKLYFLESNLYEAKSEKLVSSIQTKTKGGGSIDEAVVDFGKLLIGTMKEIGVFK